MREDGLDQVRIVFDAKLVRHGQQQSVCFSDGFVPPQLFNEFARFPGIGAAKDGAHIIDDAHLIAAPVTTEVRAITVVDEREYGSGDRYAGFSLVPSVGPCLTVKANLTGLLDVKGLA